MREASLELRRAGLRGASVVRHRRWRPRRGLHAEPPRDGCRHAGRGEHRRHLVVLLSRLRRSGRAGPLRSDRAARALLRGRLPVCRQGTGLPRSCSRDHASHPKYRARRGGAVLARAVQPEWYSARRTLARPLEPRTFNLEPRFPAPAFRAPALHHVLVRHHRTTEVHGARRRRHPAPTSKGARAPLRSHPE